MYLKIVVGVDCWIVMTVFLGGSECRTLSLRMLSFRNNLEELRPIRKWWLQYVTPLMAYVIKGLDRF